MQDRTKRRAAGKANAPAGAKQDKPKAGVVNAKRKAQMPEGSRLTDTLRLAHAFASQFDAPQAAKTGRRVKRAKRQVD